MTDKIVYEGYGKYFHQMLNMADDDLDPYEYRLLGHYLRVCGQNGECWEASTTTAEKCKMSRPKMLKTRNILAEKGYLRIKKSNGGKKKTCTITIVDRMAENIARYAPQHQQTETPTNCISEIQLNTKTDGTVNEVYSKPAQTVNEVYTKNNKDSKNNQVLKNATSVADASDPKPPAPVQEVVEPVPEKPKRKQPRNHSFNAIAEKGFGQDVTAIPKSVSGRIGKCLKEAREIYDLHFGQTVIASNYYDEQLAKIIRAFYGDYKSKDRHAVRDSTKFATDLGEYINRNKQAIERMINPISEPEPLPEPETTPEQQEAQKAKVLAQLRTMIGVSS